MRRNDTPYGLLLIMVVILGLSVACGVAKFRECYRVHPLWYCLEG